MLFGILYRIQNILEIRILSEIAESLELQMDKIPLLVDEHNKYNNHPHIELVYKNSTSESMNIQLVHQELLEKNHHINKTLKKDPHPSINHHYKKPETDIHLGNVAYYNVEKY